MTPLLTLLKAKKYVNFGGWKNIFVKCFVMPTCICKLPAHRALSESTSKGVRWVVDSPVLGEPITQLTPLGGCLAEPKWLAELT